MVYTIGETVMDIIYRSIDDVHFRPGGSMLNTSISLGRLHVPVSHISFLASDKASELLIDFMEQNHVDTKYLARINQIKTSLALAFLNKSNNAEYSFYKDSLDFEPELLFPKINMGDIILFGSFFGINTKLHPQLISFLNKARSLGAIIIYDPNFRKPHLPQLKHLLPLIEKNLAAADIVKGSDEDFKNIFNIESGEAVWQKLKQFNVKALFYTKGSEGSLFYINNLKLKHAANPIKVVSTIGAGDTFSAGIIYFLNALLQNVPIDNITEIEWDNCIKKAHEFASHTCQTMDNYLSYEFIKTVTHVQ